jgi:hypothetical protein
MSFEYRKWFVRTRTKAWGKMYLVYNDNPDNFDLAPTDKLKENLLKKKMYLCVVEIDENGKSRKIKPVSQDKKQVSYFRFENVQKIRDDLYHIQLRVRVGDEVKKFATFSIE